MTPLPDGHAPDPIDPTRPDALDLPLPGSRSTGPKTRAGKARSRANAVKHGLRCQVVEPTDQARLIASRIEEWTAALQPTDAVQHWLVARAATASVRLDRCTERETLALEENTAAAERDFCRRRRAWARRTGHKLPVNPKKAFAQLNASAFGCDWLIARWDDLAADLEIPGGFWSRAEFLHALLMLGFDYDRIPPGQPVVAKLYRASLAADRAPNPEEVEAFLNLDTKALDPESRAAEQRRVLGDREEGRRILLAFVRGEQARLRRLREGLWETVDLPALEQACVHARTFDASPEAALARRYEASQSLELHRNLNGFHRARRESEKPQEEAPPLSVPAPNERHNRQDSFTNSLQTTVSASIPEPISASPGHPEGIVSASPSLVPMSRQKQKALARKRGRRGRKTR